MILREGLFSIMEIRYKKQQMHEEVFWRTDTSIFGNDKTENFLLIWKNYTRIRFM